MLERINPTTTQAWFVLKKHFEDEMSRRHMKDLFAADEKRFETYSISTPDLLIIQKILSQKKPCNCYCNWQMIVL